MSDEKSAGMTKMFGNKSSVMKVNEGCFSLASSHALRATAPQFIVYTVLSDLAIIAISLLILGTPVYPVLVEIPATLRQD